MPGLALPKLALLLLAVTPTFAADLRDSPRDHTREVFAHPVSSRALLDTILVEPAKYLSGAQVLQGKFVHRKHLSEIPQPLTSSGEFTFARALGVHWHTQTPFDSVFVLTPHGMLQRDEGSETLRLSADDQPAVRVIANVFLALFTLDVASLQSNFELYGRSMDKGWTVGLKPKSGAVARVFKDAIVSGGREVERIVLTDAHDDRTVIELRNVTITREPPSAATQALFKR